VTHHVVGTYDSVTGVGKLYVDGILVKTTIIVAGAPLAGMQLWLGKATFGYQFAGTLDECAIYDYVLGQDRITVHVAESQAPSEDNNDIFDQSETFLDEAGPLLDEAGVFIPSGLIG
jgi:hypothetical protein